MKEMEVTSQAAFIVYRVKKMRLMKLPKKAIKTYIETEKLLKKFPNELDYVTSFFNDLTGSCGALFFNKEKNNYILSFAGTDFYMDNKRDLYADIVGICLGQGEHYAPCYKFYRKVKEKYGDNIILTGHSLGGNIAQRVALKYNVKTTVVYNTAPLYMKNGVQYFMDKTQDESLYSQRHAKYLRNTHKIMKKEQQFTGEIYRITSEGDIFTRIAKILNLDYYVGQEYIFKNTGLHGMKIFLTEENQRNLVDFFSSKNNIDNYIVENYLPFSITEIKFFENLSTNYVDKLEVGVKNAMLSEFFITGLNKNPYGVDFRVFLKELLEEIDRSKELE